MSESSKVSTAGRLAPAYTLSAVFGPNVVYGSSRSPARTGWAPRGAGVIDFQTGNQLTIAGRMPYVAHAAAVTPRALALIADAGLPVEAEIHTYRSPDEYRAVLRQLTARGLRHATQRPHPEDEIPREACVVPADLQADLNDKGRMEALVPGPWLARRRRVATAELPDGRTLLRDGRPVVLKAATPLPTGGGHCVWICRTAEEVEAARAALGAERYVVIEEFVRIQRSVCIHAIVCPDGAPYVVGFAEEVCDPDGRWLGNWLDAEGDAVPDDVTSVVLGIVRAGAALGYRGIAGIDVAFPEDGSPVVLDLNFRMNGSTPAVWLRRRVEEVHGNGSMRLRSWSCGAGFDALLRIARQAVGRGTLIPLGLYDPSASISGGLARINGILRGATREAVCEEEARLAAEGLN